MSKSINVVQDMNGLLHVVTGTEFRSERRCDNLHALKGELLNMGVEEFTFYSVPLNSSKVHSVNEL